MAGVFRRPSRVSRLKSFGGPSVWLEFTPLSKLAGAINLGMSVNCLANQPFEVSPTPRDFPPIRDKTLTSSLYNYLHNRARVTGVGASSVCYKQSLRCIGRCGI